MLRQIDHFLAVGGASETLKPHYRHLGLPSIDPELIVRMLVIGYTLGIWSERRLCEDVYLNQAYRWFCRLGLDGKVPDRTPLFKIPTSRQNWLCQIAYRATDPFSCDCSRSNYYLTVETKFR